MICLPGCDINVPNPKDTDRLEYIKTDNYNDITAFQWQPMSPSGLYILLHNNCFKTLMQCLLYIKTFPPLCLELIAKYQKLIELGKVQGILCKQSTIIQNSLLC